MRVFGWCVVLAGGLFAGLYFGGYIGGAASVNITPKGKQAVIDGLNSVADSAKSGLQSAQDKLKEGQQKATEKVQEQPAQE